MPEAPTTAELLAFALELASAADAITMRYYRQADIEARAKADASLVTRADLEVEAELRAAIAERFPDHAFLGEEDGLHGGPDAAVRWIVDPIDGTHSYVRGIPVWATLIACEVEGELTVGVASAPALGTRWWAGRGLGAYRAALFFDASGGMEASWTGEAERIHTSSIARLEESQLLYGSFRLTVDAWDGRAIELLRAAWRTRSFSDFWGYCLVAEGSAEAMIEAEISPWDIAAMLVIVEEAGGRLTDLEGRPSIEAGHSIASNGPLHDELLRRLRPGVGTSRPTDRFDKFSDAARQTLTYAQAESVRLHHNYIGPEHLLLGLLLVEGSTASRLLARLNAAPEKVRAALEFIIAGGERSRGETGLTSQAKRVIELAVNEARLLHSDRIGSEHLLLGLIAEGESIAAGVLETLAVTLHRVRAELADR